jgi:hypothetical protein
MGSSEKSDPAALWELKLSPWAICTLIQVKDKFACPVVTGLPGHPIEMDHRACARPFVRSFAFAHLIVAKPIRAAALCRSTGLGA